MARKNLVSCVPGGVKVTSREGTQVATAYELHQKQLSVCGCGISRRATRWLQVEWRLAGTSGSTLVFMCDAAYEAFQADATDSGRMTAAHRLLSWDGAEAAVVVEVTDVVPVRR